MNLDVAVCLPKEAETLALILGILSSAIQAFGATQRCIDEIRLGVNEACSNVLEHAATDDEYEVRVQIDGDQCVISVRNSGNGVDASALTDVMPDPSSPRGRGVAIMRAVMDHVDFSSEPDTGTVVHLVKTVTLHANAPATDLEARPRAADDSGRWGS